MIHFHTWSSAVLIWVTPLPFALLSLTWYCWPEGLYAGNVWLLVWRVAGCDVLLAAKFVADENGS